MVYDKSYDVYLHEEKHITYESLSSKYTVARASRRCRGTVFTVYCVRSTALSCLQGQTGTYCGSLAAEDNEVCGRYSGARVRVVHCDARVVVYTATTAATHAPRVNVGKPVEHKEQK